MLGCVKFFCALTAVSFPMAAGALATVAVNLEVLTVIVTLGCGFGLLGVFGFAAAERTESERQRASRTDVIDRFRDELLAGARRTDAIAAKLRREG